MGNELGIYRERLEAIEALLARQNRTIRILVVGEASAGKSCTIMTACRAASQDYILVTGSIGASGNDYGRTTVRVSDVAVKPHILLRDAPGLTYPSQSPEGRELFIRLVSRLLAGVKNNIGVNAARTPEEVRQLNAEILREAGGQPGP